MPSAPSLRAGGPSVVDEHAPRDVVTRRDAPHAVPVFLERAFRSSIGIEFAVVGRLRRDHAFGESIGTDGGLTCAEPGACMLGTGGCHGRIPCAKVGIGGRAIARCVCPAIAAVAPRGDRGCIVKQVDAPERGDALCDRDRDRERNARSTGERRVVCGAVCRFSCVARHVRTRLRRRHDRGRCARAKTAPIPASRASPAKDG